MKENAALQCRRGREEERLAIAPCRRLLPCCLRYCCTAPLGCGERPGAGGGAATVTRAPPPPQHASHALVATPAQGGVRKRVGTRARALKMGLRGRGRTPDPMPEAPCSCGGRRRSPERAHSILLQGMGRRSGGPQRDLHGGVFGMRMRARVGCREVGGAEQTYCTHVGDDGSTKAPATYGAQAGGLSTPRAQGACTRAGQACAARGADAMHYAVHACPTPSPSCMLRAGVGEACWGAYLAPRRSASGGLALPAKMVGKYMIFPPIPSLHPLSVRV